MEKDILARFNQRIRKDSIRVLTDPTTENWLKEAGIELKVVDLGERSINRAQFNYGSLELIYSRGSWEDQGVIIAKKNTGNNGLPKIKTLPGLKKY